MTQTDKKNVVVKRPPTPSTADTAYRATTKVPKAPSLGPGQYTPRTVSTTRASPRWSFGVQERFLPPKVSYISKHHQSDLLCSASPGPKYIFNNNMASPRGNPTGPRACVHGWGTLADNLERADRENSRVHIDADVGPGTYTPREAFKLRNAPRTVFGKADRFPEVMPFTSTTHDEHQINYSSPGPIYHANHRLTQREGRSTGFGKRRAPGDPPPKKAGRSAFLTHNIRCEHCGHHLHVHMCFDRDRILVITRSSV